MKKIIITFFLIAIAATGHAQIITSSSRKVKVHEEQLAEGKTSMMFVGLGVTGCEDFGALKAEFNYMKAISSSFNDNIVPFIGGGVGFGFSPDEGIYGHLQPFVGVMLGGPSLRFDLRLAPTLVLCDDIYLGLLVEPGVWVGNFFLGGGAGYEVFDEGILYRVHLGLSF